MQSLDALLDRSTRASERVDALQRLLRRFEPGSAQGELCVYVLEAAIEEERQARWAVRNHSDHSYAEL